jgi:glycine cleavage system H lipoate-binding protein
MSTRKFRFPSGAPIEDQMVKCIWMMSGILNYRLCDRSYDCENCPLDQALRARRAACPSAFREETSDRSRKNRIRKRGRTDAPAAETSIGTFRMAGGLFYHPNHFWARVEGGGKLRFGLDDFAQRLFGRLYAVKLPSLGSRINSADPCLRLAYCSGEVPLAVPFVGLIDQINRRLDQQPSLVNQSPYSQGWLAVVQPDGLSEGLKNMYYGQEAKDWLPHEVSRLNQIVANSVEVYQHEVGTTLQDGGVEIQELAKIVGPNQHRRILTSFFGSWIKE